MDATEGGLGPALEELNLQALARRLAAVEECLFSGEAASPRLGFSDQKLAVIASSIYRARQRRRKHFDEDLFGEPAWDMLLDLFIQQVRGERVSATSLCLAAHASKATGIRWIDILVSRGLVERLSAPDDRRLSLIRLTVSGYTKVRAYVSEGIGRFDMPSPDTLSSV